MNWNQLRYVLTIAEKKSITRAAQRLYLTQPSLSLSLKALEEELGTPLFTRGPDGLEPTYAGSLFCAWAAETDISFGRLNDKLSDIASGRRQLLRLGVSPHRGNLLLPTILSAFYRQFPSCEVHTVELSTTLLRLQLDAKQLDFIVDVPSPDTVTYCNELLLNEPILLAVPRSFLPRIQPQGGALELNALSGEPFILLPPEQMLGGICQKMCEQAGFLPDLRLQCSSVERALSLAAQQLGITFAPLIFAQRQFYGEELCYFHIARVETSRPLALVYPRSSYQSAPSRPCWSCSACRCRSSMVYKNRNPLSLAFARQLPQWGSFDAALSQHQNLALRERWHCEAMTERVSIFYPCGIPRRR